MKLYVFLHGDRLPLTVYDLFVDPIFGGVHVVCDGFLPFHYDVFCRLKCTDFVLSNSV